MWATSEPQNMQWGLSKAVLSRYTGIPQLLLTDT